MFQRLKLIIVAVCTNCKNFKGELQKVHDELKSAYLIIDLLHNEVKAKCQSVSVQENLNPVEITLFIKNRVIQIQKTCFESKQVILTRYAPSKSYQISIFNCYMVLHNLEEEPNSILKAVQNVSNASH